MEGFIYIPIIRNSKKAAIAWKSITESVNVNENQNKAILTGAKSKITVVDVDNLDVWNQLIEEYDDPDTLQAKSPNGGYHYYFQYNEAIKTAVNVNDGNIDIRNDGAYILCSPSSINEKKYKWINKKEITKMPNWLIMWLSKNNKVDKKPKTKVPSHKIIDSINQIYPIKSKLLQQILNMLPKQWCENYDRWLVVATCCKSSNQWDIFDEWSKKSKKYDYDNNLEIWQKLSPVVNINYLILYANNNFDLNLPLIQINRYYKSNIAYKNKMGITKTYCTPDIFDTENYDTFILNSDTGTGKTTCVTKFCKQHSKLDIISIVSRVSLTEQHIVSFEKQGIEMVSYQDPDFNEYENIVVQLDSILKIKKKRNYILYLDEVNSLITYLIESSTLRDKRLIIYQKLICLVKEAKYILATDADISELVTKFLGKYRRDSTLVDNTFKNYKNIKAYQYLDENKLIEKLKNRVKNKEYFICCFDSKKKLDMIYEEVFSKSQKSSFLKYTSTDSSELDDVNKTWKNKYVFFSPKIIYGIDFVPETAQDVFLFITTKTINPLQVTQQLARCRKIRSLYYFIDSKPKEIKFKSIDEVKEYYYENLTLYCELLKNFGTIYFDEDSDELKVMNNTFLELFFINEYYNDAFKSNFQFHFEDILKKKGFEISYVGTEIKRLAKDKKKELEDKIKDINDARIEQIIGDDEIKPENSECCASYQRLFDNILNIDIDDARKYKDIIFDQRKLHDHFVFPNLLKTTDFLLKKQKRKKRNEFKINLTDNETSKILLARKFEKVLGIKTLEFDKIDINKEIKIDNKLWKYYQKIMQNKTKKPENSKDLRKAIMHLYKHIAGKDIIIAERKVSSKKKDGKYKSVTVTSYSLDKKWMKRQLDLYSFRDSKYTNIQDHICKSFQLKKIKTNVDLKLDDVNEVGIEKYFKNKL